MIDWKIIAIIASVIAIAIAIALGFVLLPSLSAPSAVESDHSRRPGLLASLFPLTLLLLLQRGSNQDYTSNQDLVTVYVCVCVCVRTLEVP